MIWNLADGRELDATPLPEVMRPTRLVACLNVWNDVAALRRTIDSWRRYVTHIIAVDGAYEHSGHALSTDGTRDFLARFPNVTLIDAAGLSQCEKRTRYLRAGQPGDVLFIIDADESVTRPETLAALPSCDVGWVRINSSMYQRQYGQPRLITWRPGLTYRGRHHWIYDAEDRLLCTHQYGGTGYSHRPVDLILDNQRALGRSPERLATKNAHHVREVSREIPLISMPAARMSDMSVATRESLQILMHAYRDDGMAPSRLHTAINRTTPHSSIFFKVRPGPFNVPDQYLTGMHAHQLRMATASADIIHYHGAMSAAVGARPDARVVFHHHGTLFRNNAAEYMAQAKARGALVLLSNLELFSHVGDGRAHFLPNTVPIARYSNLRATSQVPFDGSSPFRIGHSPSKPERKGTDVFLKVCGILKERGLAVEPIVLHNLSHREVLRQKATCHAFFDSFWLGMQCSGIEAAAMGLPVIAGDRTVADRYVAQFGEIPYTYAESEDGLLYALEQMIVSPEWRAIEAARVFRYVRDHHDESAVALRYLDLLDAEFGWRSGNVGNVRTRPIRRFVPTRAARP